MDDQFGGRTDDDLFADDFEPVEAAVAGAGSLAKAVKPDNNAAKPTIPPAPTARPAPKAAAPAKVTPPKTAPARAAPAKSTPAKAAPPKRHAPARAKNTPASHASSVGAGADTRQQPSPQTSEQHGAAPPPSLAQSRHNNPVSSPRPGTVGRRPGGKAAANGQAEKNGKTEKTEKAEKGEKSGIDDKGDTDGRDGRDVQNNANEAVNANEAANADVENDDRGNGQAAPNGLKQAAASAAAAPKQPGKNGEPNMRLQSGANPRAKLTDAELNAKMEAMRIASAEKARRFEQAQRDERDHEIAFTRGMEEARRRKAAEEDKRRRNEEDRRRMDEERARNRDRKLKAMGMKDSSWDEGKEAPPVVDDDDDDQRRRGGGGGFRGAPGGMRGSRHAGGILPIAAAHVNNVLGGDSAVAATATDSAAASPAAVRGPQPGEFRGRGGRGRGRGRGIGIGIGRNIGGRGGGGGGRVAFDVVFGNGAGVAEWVQGQPDPSAMAPPGASAPELSVEEFPALPGSNARNGKKPFVPDAAATAATAAASIVPPLEPALGTWDEEVAAMDAELAAAAAAAAAAAKNGP